MKNSIIEQSITQYQQIDRLSADIEQAIRERNAYALNSIYTQMNTLQEEVKTNDGAILDLLRYRQDLKESIQMKELLDLMQQIKERNQRLMPQLIGIIAVQRNELQILRKGNSLLQGYRSIPHQTGRRISSAN